MRSDSTVGCLGPSPRRWGNLHCNIPSRIEQRAIPTQVGKSPGGRSPASRPTGHPHAGGEISGTRSYMEQDAGPSPRRWGNPSMRSCRCLPRRAIPTQVGKSGNRGGWSILKPGHPHAGGEICIMSATGTSTNGPSPRRWGNLFCSHRSTEKKRAIPTQVGKSLVRLTSYGSLLKGNRFL